jgi:hypothetical protein
VTPKSFDYPVSLQPITVGRMNKRAMVMKRLAVRKAVFVTLVAAVLAVESLAMTQVYRTFSKVPVRPQMTIDPGVVFQSL